MVVHPNRRKAVRGVLAFGIAAGACVYGAVLGELFAIGPALFFAACAVNLARTALNREPVLVADHAGIRSPAEDVSAPWSEVTAVGYAVRTYRGTTTHELRVYVRDGKAVLRRRAGQARLGRVNRHALMRDRFVVALDDRDTPPAEVAGSVEERFRLAAAADTLEPVERGTVRLLRRRGWSATRPAGSSLLAERADAFYEVTGGEAGLAQGYEAPRLDRR
jgi:hypothetical protein